MGIRFSKSIKLGDLVKINIGKNGISASVGKNGASINIGNKGTYLNVSPSAVGVKGTGVSYRKKLTGGYGNLFGMFDKDEKEDKPKAIVKKQEEKIKLDTSVIEKYNEEFETNTNLHKYVENVKSKEELLKRADDFVSASSKEVYLSAINGDKETIEALVGAFLNNLELTYNVKANYELVGNTLFLDLDLPEIEDLENTYPTIVNNKIVYKKKTSTELKEEYAKCILSLGVYLVSNIFNITSYIEKIIISAFTKRRDRNGDIKDEYIYSIKYSRNIFENTDLRKIDNIYEFILNFKNRINMSSTYSFKAIKPFENETTSLNDSLTKDAVLALKELGYKKTDIDKVIDKLQNDKFNSSGEYVKKALKILRND